MPLREPNLTIWNGKSLDVYDLVMEIVRAVTGRWVPRLRFVVSRQDLYCYEGDIGNL